jgi:hypothetical protein
LDEHNELDKVRRRREVRPGGRMSMGDEMTETLGIKKDRRRRDYVSINSLDLPRESAMVIIDFFSLLVFFLRVNDSLTL